MSVMIEFGLHPLIGINSNQNTFVDIICLCDYVQP